MEDQQYPRAPARLSQACFFMWELMVFDPFPALLFRSGIVKFVTINLTL
jgi:hypothetical protein